MKRRSCRAPRSLVSLTLLLATAAQPASGQERLEISSVGPAPRSVAVEADTAITIRFDRPVERASVTPRSFWAFGRWSGVAQGTYTFSQGDRRVTLEPERRFSAGETVMVVLSHELRAMDGSTLRGEGYSFQFWTRSRGAGFDFRELDRFSTRTNPAVSTRAYGGFGSDLDGDGFLDLTIVNEDTNDLRAFLNRGDRSGRLRRFLRPPARTGQVPSPSEPADFDFDGLVDVVVANTQDDSVSVFLGKGDGSFGRGTEYGVGGEPRGVAVLDADGDGDLDIAATSFAQGRVTVRFNDGTGEFGSSASFGSNGGERAIGAADMNGDGVLDLVVGALIAQQVHVYLGNGDGSFDLAATVPSGGEVWMLSLGDLDGDRAVDVALVNSSSDSGAVLLGDGSGALSEPRMTVTDPFPLATDLADLDGDGDLDWVTSSFFGDWAVYENDGGGGFSLARAFAAPQAASCAIPMDLDRDGVIDLALVDELEDEIVLMKSRALLFASDFEGGTTDDWARRRGAVRVITPGLRGSGHALEVPVDGTGARAYVETRHRGGEPSLEVELDLDPGALDLEPGTELEILRLGRGRGHAVLKLEAAGGRYRLTLDARDRSGWRRVGAVAIRRSGATRIGVHWADASGRALTDGYAALVKKNRVRAIADDLDNHGQRVHRVRLGLPAGARDAGRGSFVVDSFSSRR